MRYFGDNVVFFRIDSIHSPGPGCGSGFFISLTPSSWPKHNVKTGGAAKPVSLRREGTKIVASFFDGGF
jgi:hypothetical protein